MIRQDSLTLAIAEEAKKILEYSADTTPMADASSTNPSIYIDVKEDDDDEDKVKDEVQEDTGAELTGADQLTQAKPPAPQLETEEEQCSCGEEGCQECHPGEEVSEANILGANGLDDSMTPPKEEKFRALHDVKISGTPGESLDLTPGITPNPSRPAGKGGPKLEIDGEAAAQETAKTATSSTKKVPHNAAKIAASDKQESLADTTGSKPGKAAPPTKQSNPAGETLQDTTTNNPKAQPPKRGATTSDPMTKLKTEQFTSLQRAALSAMLETTEAPESRKCKCGKTFTPSYGEYERCPDCLGKQHSDAELNEYGVTRLPDCEDHSDDVCESELHEAEAFDKFDERYLQNHLDILTKLASGVTKDELGLDDSAKTEEIFQFWDMHQKQISDRVLKKESFDSSDVLKEGISLDQLKSKILNNLDDVITHDSMWLNSKFDGRDLLITESMSGTNKTFRVTLTLIDEE